MADVHVEAIVTVPCSRQDLANSNLKFGIDAGGVTQYYFKHPHDELTLALSDQYVTFPSVAAGVQSLRLFNQTSSWLLCWGLLH